VTDKPATDKANKVQSFVYRKATNDRLTFELTEYPEVFGVVLRYQPGAARASTGVKAKEALPSGKKTTPAKKARR